MSKKNSKFFYGYIVLGAIWLIYFFNVSTLLYGTSAINASMVQATGYDASVVGTAVSICTVMQGITSPIVGSLIRKTGVKPPLIVGSILLVAAGVLIAFFTNSVYMFVVFYGLLAGTGMGLAGILTTQCVVNAWFDKKKAFAMAIAVSAGGIGGFILPQICQAIAGVNWKLGWVFIAVTCAISVLLSVFVMVNHPTDIGEVPDGLAYVNKHAQSETAVAEAAAPGAIFKMSKVFREKNIYLLFSNNALRGLLYYAALGHIVLYLVDKGISQTSAVFVISIMSLASLCARFLAGIVTGKIIAPKYVSALANVCCTVAILLLLFSRALPVLYVGGAFMGAGIGLGYISYPVSLSANYGPQNFSAISGWTGCISYIVNAIGPAFVGFVATATGSYKLPFLICGALCLLGTFTALRFKKPDPERFV